MTQDVSEHRPAPVNRVKPNMAPEIWPFCKGCGKHEKTAAFREVTQDTRCDACTPSRRRRWLR